MNSEVSRNSCFVLHSGLVRLVLTANNVAHEMSDALLWNHLLDTDAWVEGAGSSEALMLQKMPLLMVMARAAASHADYHQLRILTALCLLQMSIFRTQSCTSLPVALPDDSLWSTNSLSCL